MSKTNRAPRRSAEQWQFIVNQQIQSGLSGAAFCKAEGIKYQSFMNWRLKLNRNGEDAFPTSDFIELTAPDASVADKSRDWLVELDIAPGVQLRIAR